MVGVALGAVLDASQSLSCLPVRKINCRRSPVLKCDSFEPPGSLEWVWEQEQGGASNLLVEEFRAAGALMSWQVCGFSI
jgi:hypothetical protein